MKIRNIILFITCVYTLLGLISTFFPEEGVTFKATTLTFPNISNVLGQNTENTENNEVNTEISDDIKNYLLAQKESDDYRHKYKALTAPHPAGPRPAGFLTLLYPHLTILIDYD